MRVLHITTAFPREPGDVITPWLLELLQRLRASGVECEVLTSAYKGSGDQTFDGMPVVAVPWNAGTEAAKLAAGDVGISWIPDDLWSRGKCGLKTLQYQAARLPVLANPVGDQVQRFQH